VTASEVDTASIGRKAGRGLRWSLLGNIVNKIGSLCMGLVLARLLAPSDFGIYAIAFAATQLVMNIKDVGLIAATVQWRGKLEDMAPTATTLTALFSATLYGIFFFAAPYYSALAGIPEATPVVRLLTSIILIDGLTAVRSAALLRTFSQDKLILANMVGLVVNASIAISMAAGGAGALSFAYGQVAGVTVTGVLVFLAAKVPVRVGLDREIARKLLRFGVPLAASLGVEAVLISADAMIIGRVLGATALGYYLLAFNIAGWAQSVIGSAIRYVSVPGFSRLSEQDTATLSAGVQRSVPLLFTGLVPIAALTAALASPLVAVMYGGQWAPSATVLRFLVVLTVVRMMTSFAMDILIGAGATRSALWVNMGWAAALIPSLWVGTHVDGLRGAAIGHAVAGLLVAIPLAMLALHRAGVQLAPIAPALVRPLFAGALAAAVTVLVAQLGWPHQAVELCVAGSVGLLTYVAIAVPWDQIRRWFAVIRREEAHAVE